MTVVAILLVAVASVVAVPGDAAAGEVPRGGILESTADWRQVEGGGSHACAVKMSGRLYCWGRDLEGELGDGGSNTNQAAPVQVAGGATDWARVSAGNDHTCALKANGRLYCWGRDLHGQLGNGGPLSNSFATTPVEVAGGATNWSTVSAGIGFTCATKTDGRLYCWGREDDGELGNGGDLEGNATAPVRVGTARTWTSVSAGTAHACGRRSNGRAYCWGDNSVQQLGDGAEFRAEPSPVLVGAPAVNVVGVTAANSHTCARTSTQRIYCWGSDAGGRLGNGPGTRSGAVPMEIAGGGAVWATLSAGSFHTCATKTNGRLYCWGSNSIGQLGIGAITAPASSPTPVGSAGDWVASAGGDSFGCGLRTSRRLFCWGSDDLGVLGNGPPIAHSASPVEVQ